MQGSTTVFVLGGMVLGWAVNERDVLRMREHPEMPMDARMLTGVHMGPGRMLEAIERQGFRLSPDMLYPYCNGWRAAQ